MNKALGMECSTVGSMLALHMVTPGSIIGIPEGPQAQPGQE